MAAAVSSTLVVASDESPPVPELTLRQLNRMRAGYLVMGLGLAVVEMAASPRRQDLGAEGRHSRLHARGALDTGAARPALPASHGSCPAVRSRLEAHLARSRRCTALVGRQARRRHPRAGRRSALVRHCDRRHSVAARSQALRPHPTSASRSSPTASAAILIAQFRPIPLVSSFPRPEFGLSWAPPTPPEKR